MTKTKAIVLAIREDFSTTINSTRNEFKNYWRKQIEAFAGKFFAWALSKRMVQNVVVDAFANGTPMCGLLDKVVEDKVESFDRSESIDAGEIRGLDDYIATEVDQKLGDLAGERWFKDELAEAIDHDKVAEEMADNEELLNALAEKTVGLLIERLRG